MPPKPKLKLDLSGINIPTIEEFIEREFGRAQLCLDEEAADGGKHHTQDEWIAYFNQRNKRMASMPDFYLAGKSNDQKLADSLRRDFKQSRIVTSTRIEYREGDNAKIIHNYGSTLIQPVEHRISIPEYRPRGLEEVLNTNEGLRFLQILFETNDSAQQMKDVLQKLSNCSVDKINIWSAGRPVQPTERVAGFGIYDSQFHVYGSFGSGPGCSRGVRLA